MKYTTRDLVTLAVFGALWGVVEIGLGSVLHAIRMPMTGLTLSLIGVMVAMIGRLFVPRRGSTLFIGVIAMVLKLFSIGSSVIGPMIGILSEAVAAELVLSAFGKPSRLAFLLAGALAALMPLIQPFFTAGILYGVDLAGVWSSLLSKGESLFGLPASAAVWIVLLLILFYAALGVVSGWLAWGIGKLVIARLGRGNPPAG